MMEDTPSNYNIPNGRLDGKSIGLKAVLKKFQDAALGSGRSDLISTELM